MLYGTDKPIFGSCSQ